VYRNHAKGENRSIMIIQYDTRFEVLKMGVFISVEAQVNPMFMKRWHPKVLYRYSLTSLVS